MKTTQYIFLLLYAALVIPLHAEQQMLRMEASVSPSEIFLGEAAQLTIFVHGYRPELGEPDLSALPADIQLINQQDRSQHSIQIVNGRQQVSRLSGRIFTYSIEPHETGTFRISPITLEDPEGQPLPVDSPTLEVNPIPLQTHVQLWVSAPTNTIIVDEEFPVSLFVRIRKPTPPYHTHSPIPEAPHLHVPYLDLHPGEGLKSENITQLLQRLLVREGESFRINNRVIGRDPFGGMFGREDTARFRLPRITDPDDENYFLYELRSLWSADREGDYTFGPVRFRGNVITQVAADGSAVQSNIYALGESATVQVRTPPRRGRPSTFVGAAGTHFTIETHLDTQVCQAGDPVTLTVAITGDGAPNRIRSPRPDTLMPLEQDFRIQQDPIRSESLSRGRRFEYLIRPRQAGTLEIPALEIAYFDLSSRTYQTVQSDPLPIRVNPSQELEHEMISGLPIRGQRRFGISAPPGDLPPAPFDLQHAKPSHLFQPARHLPLLLVGPVIFLLAFLRKWLPRHIPAMQAHVKRKNALQYAKQQLQQPESNAVNILREYLITTMGRAFAQGDSQTMRNVLESQGVAPNDIDEIVEILTQTAYSGQQQSDAKRIQPLIQTIAETNRQQKQRALFGDKRGMFSPILMLLLASTLLCTLRADEVSRFEERRSNLLLLQSQTPEHFMEAAHALADRVDQGERSPVLLYNLGTALLLADQPTLAMPLLQWAERRGADNWNTRRNMLVARRMITQDPTSQLPWYRAFLFWHYRTAIPNRITITAALFTLIWILVTIRSIAPYIRWLMLPTVILLFLFSISITASLYAEHQNEQDWQLQRRQIQRIFELHQEENNE